MSYSSTRTDTDIANMAMDLLSEPPFDFENPQTQFERTVVRRYGDARDLILKRHFWSPARTQINISVVAESNGNVGNIATLPNDCLQVWFVGRQSKGWQRISGPGAGRIQGSFSSPVNVIYGRRLSAGETPIELARVIAAALALELAPTPAIKSSRSKIETLERRLDDAEQDALLILGTEGGEREIIPSRYVDALYGGLSDGYYS